MFPMPINLHLTEPWADRITLKGAAIRAFSREGWTLRYSEPLCEEPHLLAIDSRYGGYKIGVLVHKVMNGSIVCRLENPSGYGMSEWQIPFKGQITGAKIVEAIISCIDVFENEEIPEPEEDDA